MGWGAERRDNYVAPVYSLRHIEPGGAVPVAGGGACWTRRFALGKRQIKRNKRMAKMRRLQTINQGLGLPPVLRAVGEQRAVLQRDFCKPVRAECAPRAWEAQRSHL